MIRHLPADVKACIRTGFTLTSFAQTVEELVLNGIDAGATSVAVRIDFSCFKVQVVDNGAGISQDQFQFIGERYSTSKCHRIEDLENLKYFGYRGEALASIRTAASFLEIVSRSKASIITHTKCFQNGKALAIFQTSQPRPSVGTTVTAHDLFYNLPVRRKRVNAALEMERIRYRLAGIALMWPSVSFSLRDDSDGHIILQTHKCSGMAAAFSYIFTPARARGLMDVSAERDEFKLTGFVSKECYSRMDLQFVFVNKRLVLKSSIHRQINKILTRSLILRRKGLASEVLEKGLNAGGGTNTGSPQKQLERFAIFAVNVECPYDVYDITFDPSKTLVEFKDWPKLIHLLQDMLYGFLRKENLISISEPVSTVSPDYMNDGDEDDDEDSSQTTAQSDILPRNENLKENPPPGVTNKFGKNMSAVIEHGLFSKSVHRPKIINSKNKLVSIDQTNAVDDHSKGQQAETTTQHTNEQSDGKDKPERLDTPAKIKFDQSNPHYKNVTLSKENNENQLKKDDQKAVKKYKSQIDQQCSSLMSLCSEDELVSTESLTEPKRPIINEDSEEVLAKGDISLKRGAITLGNSIHYSSTLRSLRDIRQTGTSRRVSEIITNTLQQLRQSTQKAVKNLGNVYKTPQKLSAVDDDNPSPIKQLKMDKSVKMDKDVKQPGGLNEARLVSKEFDQTCKSRQQRVSKDATENNLSDMCTSQVGGDNRIGSNIKMAKGGETSCSTTFSSTSEDRSRGQNDRATGLKRSVDCKVSHASKLAKLMRGENIVDKPEEISPKYGDDSDSLKRMQILNSFIYNRSLRNPCSRQPEGHASSAGGLNKLYGECSQITDSNVYEDLHLQTEELSSQLIPNGEGKTGNNDIKRTGKVREQSSGVTQTSCSSTAYKECWCTSCQGRLQFGHAGEDLPVRIDRLVFDEKENTEDEIKMSPKVSVILSVPLENGAPKVNQPESKDRSETSKDRLEPSKDRSETSKDRLEPSKDRPETSKDRPETSKDRPETSKDRPETSKDRPETNKDRPETGKDRPEPSKDRPETSKDRPETSKDRPETGKDRPETSKDRPEPSKDRPETSKDRPETSKDRPEKSKDRPETGKDRPETSKDRPETSKDRPETSKDRPETSKDRPETSKDRLEKSKLVLLSDLNRCNKVLNNDTEQIESRYKFSETSFSFSPQTPHSPLSYNYEQKAAKYSTAQSLTHKDILTEGAFFVKGPSHPSCQSKITAAQCGSNVQTVDTSQGFTVTTTQANQTDHETWLESGNPHSGTQCTDRMSNDGESSTGFESTGFSPVTNNATLTTDDELSPNMQPDNGVQWERRQFTDKLGINISHSGHLDSVSDIGRLDYVSDIGRLDSVSDIRCLNSVSDIGCLDSVSDIRHLDSVSDIRCLDSVSDIRHLDSVSDIRCLDSVSDIGCLDSVSDIRCLDSVSDIRCLDSVSDINILSDREQRDKSTDVLCAETVSTAGRVFNIQIEKDTKSPGSSCCVSSKAASSLLIMKSDACFDDVKTESGKEWFRPSLAEGALLQKSVDSVKPVILVYDSLNDYTAFSTVPETEDTENCILGGVKGSAAAAAVDLESAVGDLSSGGSTFNINRRDKIEDKDLIEVTGIIADAKNMFKNMKECLGMSNSPQYLFSDSTNNLEMIASVSPTRSTLSPNQSSDSGPRDVAEEKPRQQEQPESNSSRTFVHHTSDCDLILLLRSREENLRQDSLSVSSTSSSDRIPCGQKHEIGNNYSNLHPISRHTDSLKSDQSCKETGQTGMDNNRTSPSEPQSPGYLRAAFCLSNDTPVGNSSREALKQHCTDLDDKYSPSVTINLSCSVARQASSISRNNSEFCESQVCYTGKQGRVLMPKAPLHERIEPRSMYFPGSKDLSSQSDFTDMMSTEGDRVLLMVEEPVHSPTTPSQESQINGTESNVIERGSQAHQKALQAPMDREITFGEDWSVAGVDSGNEESAQKSATSGRPQEVQADVAHSRSNIGLNTLSDPLINKKGCPGLAKLKIVPSSLALLRSAGLPREVDANSTLQGKHLCMNDATSENVGVQSAFSSHNSLQVVENAGNSEKLISEVPVHISEKPVVEVDGYNSGEGVVELANQMTEAGPCELADKGGLLASQRRIERQTEDAMTACWRTVTDPETGQQTYVNNQSGHTFSEEQWEQMCSQIQMELLAIPAHAVKVTTVSDPVTLSTSQKQAFKDLVSDHFEREDNEAVSKWRGGERPSYDKNIEADVSALMANWKNPVLLNYKQPGLLADICPSGTVARSCFNSLSAVEFNKSMLGSIKVIGQLDKKFIACVVEKPQDITKALNPKSSSLLVLFDQHAVHERIRLEHFTRDVYEVENGERTDRIKRSEVRPAQAVTMDQDDLRIMKAFKEEFNRIGVSFTVVKASRDTVHIDCFPSCLVDRNASEMKISKMAGVIENVETLIKEHIELLKSTNGVCGRLPLTVHKVLCSMACHGAVKFGDKLTLQECQDLLSSLASCSLPFQCAHGRPSVAPLVNLSALERELYSEKRRPNLRKISENLNK